MNRRDFLKNGAITIAALKLGEVISLSPTKLNASKLKLFNNLKL